MVHVNNYSGIQKSTMALHKYGQRKYTLWAVFGFYMALKSGSASRKLKRWSSPACNQTFWWNEAFTEMRRKRLFTSVSYQMAKQKKELAEFLKSDQVKTWDLLDLNVLFRQLWRRSRLGLLPKATALIISLRRSVTTGTTGRLCCWHLRNLTPQPRRLS